MRKLLLLILFSCGLLSASQAQPVPAKALSFYKQALVLAGQGKQAEALPLLKKATDAYPKYFDAYLEAAIICSRLSIVNDAKFCYAKAIACRPNSCEGYVAFGNYYKETRGRADSALMYYEKALALKCDTSGMFNYNMGWCYNERNMFSKALPILKKAILFDSTSKPFINEISFSFKKLDILPEGIAYFQHYYETTKVPLYLYYIGLMYVDLKDKDKATATYNELIKVEPKFAAGLDKKIKAMP
jgi:tetratricopeptide (TPR) repeat protein